MTNFKIRTFGRTELAQLYCPELCPQAAFRKLNQWIDLYPNLREELLALGLSPKSRTYQQPDTYHPHLQLKRPPFIARIPLCPLKDALRCQSTTPRC